MFTISDILYVCIHGSEKIKIMNGIFIIIFFNNWTYSRARLTYITLIFINQHVYRQVSEGVILHPFLTLNSHICLVVFLVLCLLVLGTSFSMLFGDNSNKPIWVSVFFCTAVTFCIFAFYIIVSVQINTRRYLDSPR